MDHRRRLFFITIMLGLLLTALPCLGGTPQPTGGSTTPDVHPTHLPDITVGPIAYQGPTLSDIGMKLIAYAGPDLPDITVAPIQFAHPTVALVKKPSLQKAATPSVNPNAIALAPQRIPGVAPGIKILSPMPGQTVAGSVLLEVAVTGWHGTPPVKLDWWWSPPSAPGKWPATPQGMTVVDRLDGKTHITLPRSAFPKAGLWRLEASVQVSDHQRVVDDVSFSLAGMLPPKSASGAQKLLPKKIAPAPVPNQMTTAPRVPRLPAPVRPQVEKQ